MKCSYCHDTGSLSKSIAGYPDCGHCAVADERVHLEAWARRNAPSAGLIDLWLIYQHGKAAAQSKTPACRGTGPRRARTELAAR